MRKVVYFEWTDAVGKSGWGGMENVPAPVLIKSIGWLVEETDAYIAITPGLDVENDNFMSILSVPKAWIKKRRYIKL